MSLILFDSRGASGITASCSGACPWCTPRHAPDRSKRGFRGRSQVRVLRLAPCPIRRSPSRIRNRLELALVPSQPVFDVRSCFHLPSIAQRALPDDGHSPSGIEEVTSGPSVSLHVFSKLGLPEVRTRRRSRRVSAPRVPMPEAAMHKTHSFKASEHEVRSTRETPTVKSVSETASVKCPSERELGLRAPVPDSRHHA